MASLNGRKPKVGIYLILVSLNKTSSVFENWETKVKTIYNKGRGWKAKNTATSATTILNHQII